MSKIYSPCAQVSHAKSNQSLSLAVQHFNTTYQHKNADVDYGNWLKIQDNQKKITLILAFQK